MARSYRNRWKNSSLYGTSRLGKRTGHIEIPLEQTDNLAEKIIKGSFVPCDNYSFELSDKIKTKVSEEENYMDSFRTLDAHGFMPVFIKIIPTYFRKEETNSSVTIKGMGGPIKKIDRDSGRERIIGRINLYPDNNKCLSKSKWKAIINSILLHELTHVLDPRLHPKLPVKRITSRDVYEKRGFCAHANVKEEQKAYLTQVAFDLKTSKTKLKQFKSPEEALNTLSSTYKRISHCLTKESKKKFLRMVARYWETENE